MEISFSLNGDSPSKLSYISRNFSFEDTMGTVNIIVNYYSKKESDSFITGKYEKRSDTYDRSLRD